MEDTLVGDYPTKVTESGAVILIAKGRLNRRVSHGLRDQLEDLVQSGSNRLVVDLTSVEAIDSSGLGALIAGLKATRQMGGDLRIAAANEQVRAVLAVTNLDRVLSSYDSVELAVGGWT